ncbi:MAG: radical SAM protein [Candidatus Aminicenantes bacterium]|nr:radical SAM protein [Candidatus Aminicenantes bacterium]
MSKKKDKSPAFHTYGPVPSRRLGFSLGIDIIPFKTCSLNCIYCQLGQTPKKTIRRKEYFSASDIISQIKKKLDSGQRIDYITFSGSGEPTLNNALGKIIKEIKKATSIPVAVLTNSTLLSRQSVRSALMGADLVIPSLDAATQQTFVKVNRPHSSISIKEIMQGLLKFSKEFKGSIWLEIMLVKGVNDSPSHIRKLKQAIAKIKPEKVQLNTVIRPPAEKHARHIGLKDLEKIRNILGENCEIIAESSREAQISSSENLEAAILSLVQRRPVTLADISASLGKGKEKIKKSLDALLAEGKIKSVTHKGSKYFEPK